MPRRTGREVARRRGWPPPTPSRPRQGVYQQAADAAGQAAAAMRATSSPGQASAIAGAAADVLAAAAQAWEGLRGGPLTDAAEVFDRAAYEPRRPVPARRVSQAMQLRAMARLISVMGALSRDEDTMAALHLVYTLAALAESLAICARCRTGYTRPRPPGPPRGSSAPSRRRPPGRRRPNADQR